MGIFNKLTQGDLDEVKHGIELLDTRTTRLQKSIRSSQATAASLSRRIKVLEKILAGAVSPVDQEDDEDADLGLDEGTQEEEDVETRRLKLRAKYGESS